MNKGRIKSSSEQLQDNKELNRNETSANWKQLAEQTGYYQYLKITFRISNKIKLKIYARYKRHTGVFLFCSNKASCCIRIKRHADKVKNIFAGKQPRFLIQITTKTRLKQIHKNFSLNFFFSFGY